MPRTRKRWLHALLLVASASAACHAATPPDAALEHAQRLLDSTILIDGHNDLPLMIRLASGGTNSLNAIDLRKPTRFHTDIPRLRAGRVGAQFWSVYVDGEADKRPAVTQLEQIDLARRMIEAYPDTFAFASTAAEIRAAHARGRIASLLGAEGGHVIENSLGALREFYALGVRYMTLTHFSHNDWADSATQVPARHHGLAPFGKEVVREMNRLGMLVDIAHTSPETMAQALEVSEAPVIFSHADALGVTKHPRNVPDDILRQLARNGGVLMVSFIPDFVDEKIARVMGPLMLEYGIRARQAKTPEEAERLIQEIFGHADIPTTNVAAVADHIDYVRRIAGVDHVGIGSDFTAPASAGGIDMPQGLEDVSKFPNLFAELIRRGWTNRDLRKLAGENVLRVMEQVEKTAARLQKSRPASTMKYTPDAR